MKNRALTFVLALVLAAVGTGAVLSYASGANSRALAGLKVETVLTAAQEIPRGTSAATALAHGLIKSEQFPVSTIPPGVLATIPQQLRSLVADADIQPGQLLTRAMWGTQAPASTGGLQIPAGMQAVTITVCEAEDVAGMVQAGARVDIYDATGTKNVSLSDSNGCSGAHSWSGDVVGAGQVFSNLQVLAVAAPAGSAGGGLTGGSSGSGASSTTLVTLAASPAIVKRLIVLNVSGVPYITLPSNEAPLPPAGAP